jgi:two-component system chemotaxis response regulator CheY
MSNKDILVLVVDDSPTMRRIIKNTLDRIGYNNSIEAENGKQALDLINSNPVELLLTDWNMPVMNGLELVGEVRKIDKYKKLPILMITTRGMKEDVVQAVHAGVNNYVVKPFTPEILEEKINKVL